MHKTNRFHHVHTEDRAHQLRRRVALEAARLISEHGIHDYGTAKRKAAQRIKASNEGCLPRNCEVASALREHQRLFRADRQRYALHKRRETAREAMRFLGGFEPRLVGAVLDGTADTHSPVTLHVFEGSSEAVAMFLHEHRIDFETRARTLRLDRERSAQLPMLWFYADAIKIEVIVFPVDALRQAPLDAVNECPQQRASLAVVNAMLTGETGRPQDGKT